MKKYFREFDHNCILQKHGFVLHRFPRSFPILDVNINNLEGNTATLSLFFRYYFDKLFQSQSSPDVHMLMWGFSTERVFNCSLKQFLRFTQLSCWTVFFLLLSTILIFRGRLSFYSVLKHFYESCFCRQECLCIFKENNQVKLYFG